MDLRGFEFDWLACDGVGHVALFSTAGGGFTPPGLTEDMDAQDAAIAAILATQICRGARVALELPSARPNTWRMAAERGLFAFDSDPNGGPYQRIAVPGVPVVIADLPTTAAVVVGRLRFHNLRFAELSAVPTEMLRQPKGHR